MEHLQVAVYVFVILFGVCRACGSHFNSSTGIINSPGHPQSYQDNTICEWIIEDPNKNQILLNVKRFDLENDEICRFDYLEVRNGDSASSPLIGKYCGTIIPEKIFSLGYQIYLKFVTDGSNTYEGFNITWSSATGSYRFDGASTIRRQEFYSLSGVITSPNYPELYPNNVVEEYIITAPEYHPVVLHVKEFSLELDSQCDYDYLEIRSSIRSLVQNGNTTETSTLLGKYCGSNIPKKITSIGNRILLHFKTDYSNMGNGFIIEWDSSSPGCGGNLTTNRGIISSPYYPEPYNAAIQCAWTIQVSAGSIIQFILVDLEFETIEQCKFDFLKIFDGSVTDGKELGTYCQTINRPLHIETISNVASISFHSESPVSGRRFQIIYHSGCHNKLYGYEGVIESPNFPDKYPHGVNCSWIIETPIGSTMHLTFSKFDLEEGLEGYCNGDYLEIKEGKDDEPNRQIGKFCNSKAPPPVIVSAQRQVFLQFHSDNSVSRNGFRLEWVVNVNNLIPPPSRSCLLWSELVSRRDDYTYTMGVGRHKLHTQAMTWNEARITCEEEGGYLAIINSIAELNAITELFRNSTAITGSAFPDFITIGLHDFYREGQFVTIHGESLNKVGFSQWANGQPDGLHGSENCGALSISGHLYDVSCGSKWGFVCEIPIY